MDFGKTERPTWVIETFENDTVKGTLSLVSNEHWMQKEHRDKCKTLYNLKLDVFKTQDRLKGDEWQEGWYDEDFTTFGSAYQTFDYFKMMEIKK